MSSSSSFSSEHHLDIVLINQSKGSIITSLSHSTPSLPIPPALYDALSITSPKPLTAYTKHNPIHLEHARSGLRKIEVPWTMSSEDAVGIWRIWAKKGWARGMFFFLVDHDTELIS
jgi:hypothetical protein